MHPSHDADPYAAQQSSDTSRGSAVLPFNVLRVREDFETLKPRYRGWLMWQGPEDPESIMGLVSFVLTNCAMRETTTTITALSVPTLRTVLEFVEESFPETLENTKLDMVGFLEFLDETDEFTGSDQLFEDLYDLVDPEEEVDWAEFHSPREPDFGSTVTMGPTIDAPPAAAPVAPKTVVDSSSLDKDETLAALDALTLTVRARALLKWIGELKDVTATGVLRRNDIKPAAARLGVKAVGSATGSPVWHALGMSFGILEVRSMPEVPRLDLYWQMLCLTGLIKVSGKRVGLTEFGWTFVARHTTSTPKAVLGMAAVAYQVLTGVVPRSNGELELSGDYMAAVFVAGATSHPWSVESVVEGTENGEPLIDQFSRAVTNVVGKRIKDWSDDELLETSTKIRIPEVLLPALATALAKPYKLVIGAPRSP